MTPNVGNLLLEASAPAAGAIAQTAQPAEGAGDQFDSIVKTLLEGVPDAEMDSTRAGQQASGKSKEEDEEQTVLMASLLGSWESGRQILAQVTAEGNTPDLPTNVEPARIPTPPVSTQVAAFPVETQASEAAQQADLPMGEQSPVASPQLVQPNDEDTAVATEAAPTDAERADKSAGRATAQPEKAPDWAVANGRPEEWTPKGESDEGPMRPQKEWNPRSAASLIDPPAAWRRDQVDLGPANVRANPEPADGPALIATLRGFHGNERTDVDPETRPDLPISRLATDVSGEGLAETAASVSGKGFSETTGADVSGKGFLETTDIDTTDAKTTAEPAWIAFTRRPEWIPVQAANAAEQAGRFVSNPTAGATLLPVAEDVEPVKAADPGNRASADPGHGGLGSLLSDPSLAAVRRPENASATERLLPAREVSVRVINQIVRAAKTQVFDGGAAMTLRLDPPHLGALQMTVTTTDAGVTAAIRASAETTRQLIQANMAELKEALAQSGVNIDSINVSVGNGPDQGWNLPGRHGEEGNQHGHSNGSWRTLANDNSNDEDMTAAAAGRQRHHGYGFDHLA